MEITDRTPVLEPGHTYGSVTREISEIPLTTLKRTPRAWILGFFIAFLVLMLPFYSRLPTCLSRGVGIWGINIPVGWGFAIINFVWWIGIGHAGTLISAILLLMRQDWRTSINRFAEAMTLFAVANALLFPILHLGRPVAVLLPDALPQLDAPLAAVPQPAGVGCVRHHHLCPGLAAVLVYGPGARPGDDARPGDQ